MLLCGTENASSRALLALLGPIIEDICEVNRNLDSKLVLNRIHLVEF
jgi:hypothetical protein